MPLRNQIFSNNSITLLTDTLTSGGESASLLDGSNFSTPTSEEYEIAVLDDGVNIELIKISARSGNTITIEERGLEGSTPAEFVTGSFIRVGTTKGFLENLVHGEFTIEDTTKIIGNDYVALPDNSFGDENSTVTANASAQPHVFTGPPVCLGVNSWTASTVYKIGAVVTPTTPNNYSYYVSVAGTSSGTEPASWSTTPYAEVTDGGVTWICIDPTDVVIKLPDRIVFIPTELGFIGQGDTASATIQPYVSFGITSDPDKWLTTTQTSELTGPYSGQKFDPVNSEGASILVAGLTTVGDGATIGRFYWRGICVESSDVMVPALIIDKGALNLTSSVPTVA